MGKPNHENRGYSNRWQITIHALFSYLLIPVSVGAFLIIKKGSNFRLTQNE